LQMIGPSASSDIKTLVIAQLKDSDSSVRVSSITTLLRMSDPPPYQTFLPLLEDRDNDVRRAAAQAVADLGDKDALPAFVQASQDPDSGVRSWAVVGMERIGPSAIEPLMA